VIRDKEDLLFQEMLLSQDVLRSHPRKGQKSLKAVASLKAYWEKGMGNYGWTDFKDEEDQ
jgi:hypothetical protein